MTRNKLNIYHIHINLEDDLIWSENKLLGTFTEFKFNQLKVNKAMCMRYKLRAKYDYDGEISYIIAWDKMIEELIKDNRI
jgi:hypothetical protein